MRSTTIGNTPYQWDPLAEAGIILQTGERWWGTRVKWRPGTAGRWRSFVLIDVHPLDAETLERAVALRLAHEHTGGGSDGA